MIPTDAAERKNLPIMTGVLDYFPLALLEVARVSKVGNDQHNPGEPLHWARGKSTDHADSCVRHLMERGKLDTDQMLHSAKAAWRALANLQEELEELEARARSAVALDRPVILRLSEAAKDGVALGFTPELEEVPPVDVDGNEIPPAQHPFDWSIAQADGDGR